MNKSSNNRFILIVYSLLIVLLDQITKSIVFNKINYRESFVLIPKILKITLEKNTGAAFSLFSSSTSLLTFISFSVSAVLIVILWRFTPTSKYYNIALPFLLGGTIGNGVDRLFKGFVLDIFELIPFSFPIFNVADIAINISLVFMMLEIIKTSKIKNEN